MGKTTDKFVPNTTSVPETKHETHLNHGHGRRIGTPCDARGSNPGDVGNATAHDIIAGGMPAGWGSSDGAAAISGLMAAQGAGDGGGASAAMESENGMDSFKACLEGLAMAYPNSDAVSEMRNMFAGLMCGNKEKPELKPIYHSADGLSQQASPDTVAQLAAACEATLNAFKNQTGMDYLELRSKH